MQNWRTAFKTGTPRLTGWPPIWLKLWLCTLEIIIFLCSNVHFNSHFFSSIFGVTFVAKSLRTSSVDILIISARKEALLGFLPLHKILSLWRPSGSPSQTRQRLSPRWWRRTRGRSMTWCLSAPAATLSWARRACPTVTTVSAAGVSYINTFQFSILQIKVQNSISKIYSQCKSS